MLLAQRYEVIDAPLKGGMGLMYPCMDSILERKVAIKAIQAGTEERRIVDEIRALLRLRSKHVVQVYDILRFDDGSIGIVQEFIDGPDLFDDQTKSSSRDALYRQLWQISSGIADIHAADTIHRDLKPNNMKVDPEGVIKIFDFGLARSTAGDASTMGFVGTRGFAAPELYGTSVMFTAAIDVYAFGATALYLSSRTLPDELIQQPPREIDPVTVARHMPDVDKEVIDLITACLRHSPAARPAMAEVSHALSRHLLKDRHQGLLVYQGTPSYLNAKNRKVTANLQGMGGIQVAYSGLDFVVEAVTGAVYINNQQARVGQNLPGSCVIALGAPEQGSLRKYITFDLTSPEVVL